MTDPLDSDPTSDPSEGAAARTAAVMDEAALWLAQLDSGSADPEAFERWRSADPMRAVAIARLGTVWSALDAAPIVDPIADLAAAPVPVRRTAGVSRRLALFSIGGLAIAAVGIGLSGRASARERAETLVGERRTIRLGSRAQLELNTDSQASWHRREGRLSLWLERGEAAIMVEAGADAIVVHAGRHGGGIECWLAPGRYNMRLIDGRMEVTTLTGRAEGRVSRGRSILALQGDRLIAVDGAVTAAAAPAGALEMATAWPRGEIVFDDIRLAEAVVEYNRYLERKIVVSDTSVADLRIGGRFTSADPSDFIAALQAVLPVQARQTADGVRLSRAGLGQGE